MWEAVLLNNKKLNLWAQQLLDTGKRNNMINFKDTKISTIEIVYPSAEVFYDNCINSTTFEIYAPKINDDKNNNNVISPVNSFAVDKLEKSEYIEFYSSRIRKNNQVLVYANTSEPMKAINNIGKKAKDFLEETEISTVRSPEGDSVFGYDSLSKGGIQYEIKDGAEIEILAKKGKTAGCVVLEDETVCWIDMEYLTGNSWNPEKKK